MISKFKYESKDKVLIISDNKVDILPVVKVDEKQVETNMHIFPIEDTKALINPAEGGIYYVVNCSLQYLQECQNLKELSENIAIKNMFNFGEQEKKFDIKFYIMMAVLVITIFLLRG